MNRYKLTLFWSGCLVLLLVACGGAAPEATANQSTTNLLVPTAPLSDPTRQTQQTQETMTAAVVPTFTPTRQSNSLVPAPTKTVTVAAATPTPTSPPPPQPTGSALSPTIHSLTAELSDHPDGVNKMVTFQWQTSGGTTVRINDYVYGYSRFVPGWNVAASGTMTITLDPTLNRNLTYEMLVYNESDYSSIARQPVVINWPCVYSYYFPQPEYLAACPVDEAVTSAAAEQHFEHGRMIWLGTPQHPLFTNLPTILVIYDASEYPQQPWQSYFDHWTPDLPLDDPTLIPPTGLYQPVRGFGQVWRSNPEVQERLGWAITPELSYTATTQSVPYEPEYGVFLSLSDGLVIWLGRASYDGSTYWQWLE